VTDTTRARKLIVTPPAFRSLLTPIAHDNPQTYVFRGGELLLRETDLALPDPAVVKTLALADGNVFPVGVYRKEYCAAAWVARETQPPAGFMFKGLRSLFGRLDEETLAIAGRAFQIAAPAASPWRESPASAR